MALSLRSSLTPWATSLLQRTSPMSVRRLPIALLQMRSGTDPEANVAFVCDQVREAARLGARLVVTPEMTTALDRRPGMLLASARAQHEDASVQAYSALARECRVDVLIGSMAIKVSDSQLANRSLYFDASGEVIAHYDKIHLFDADLGEGQRYEESARFAAGQQAVVVRRTGFTMGLTVCYDMRFPALYRDLALAGADIISVPSSFTVPTGQAHWHVLLRARAIETGCFVLAPAQHGVHEDGRETYGHSVVINPWGEVVAEQAEGTGLLMYELEMAEVAEARKRLPSLQNARPYRP
jgi:predicted amidohydrolase